MSAPETWRLEPAPVTLTEEPEAEPVLAMTTELPATRPLAWIDRLPSPALPANRVPALFRLEFVPDTVTAAAGPPVPETSMPPLLAMLAPPVTSTRPLPTVIPVPAVQLAPGL